MHHPEENLAVLRKGGIAMSQKTLAIRLDADLHARLTIDRPPRSRQPPGEVGQILSRGQGVHVTEGLEPASG